MCRQRDQRTVCGFGLHPNPAPVKLRALQAARSLPFDHKASALQRNPLAICGMAAEPGRANGQNHDGQCSKGDGPWGPRQPKNQGGCQRHGTQPQPGARHWAIAIQLPVNALAGHRGKTKNQTRQCKRLENRYDTCAVRKGTPLSSGENCSAPCSRSLTSDYGLTLR